MDHFSALLHLSHDLERVSLNRNPEGRRELARDARNSGADIDVEDDLALLFGRCHITFEMAREFHNADLEILDLTDGIKLCNGPGPTVSRALFEPPGNPYLAMVVQCSLLAATHDITSLARHSARAFEREQVRVSVGRQIQRALSAENARGTLAAIDEQTTWFDWRAMLVSIASRLGLGDPDTAVRETIPFNIFEVLMVLLASVQRFPEERVLLIDTTRAACVLVAWTHYILGLSVLVRRVVGGQTITDMFGDGREQVIIDLHPKLPEQCKDSAALWCRDGTQLFRTTDLRANNINGSYRAPATGWGARYLQHYARSAYIDGERLVREGMMLSAAFAWKFCSRLLIAFDVSPEVDDANNFMPYNVDGCYILEAILFLFGVEEISDEEFETIQTYVNHLCGGTLLDTSIPPGMLSNTGIIQSDWEILRSACFEISVLIYAFAHVDNLNECIGLSIVEMVIPESHFKRLLTTWEIGSPLKVTALSCLDIMSKAITGDRRDPDFHQMSLISKHGWSVFLSSMTENDPGSVRKGAVTVLPGTPCLVDVYKHRILEDGTGSPDESGGILSSGSGSQLSSACLNAISLDLPDIEEKDDSFVVSRGYVDNHSSMVTEKYRTGYSELYAAQWFSQNTTKCPHACNEQDTVSLPPGCIPIYGFGDFLPLSLEGQVFIYQTAGNKHARWRALLAIANIKDPKGNNGKDRTYHPVLLKTDETCLQCAVNEAVAYPMTPCFLVL
ncbi:hypothetical protein GGR53DRAFT_464580 [Hypoxylon sp. FL1150]|nr:hypothetical protein GGR53DRAFT_464580 [Hypoxylon sp. FL1150]